MKDGDAERTGRDRQRRQVGSEPKSEQIPRATVPLIVWNRLDGLSFDGGHLAGITAMSLADEMLPTGSLRGPHGRTPRTFNQHIDKYINIVIFRFQSTWTTIPDSPHIQYYACGRERGRRNGSADRPALQARDETGCLPTGAPPRDLRRATAYRAARHDYPSITTRPAHVARSMRLGPSSPQATPMLH